MSKREFLEDHPYVGDLLDYAYEHDVYAVTENLVYEDDIDSHIEDQIRDFLNNDSWSRLSSYLDDISTGYSFYLVGDDRWFDYRGIGEDDYDEILQMIVDDLGEDYVYGEEEPEEEEEESEEEECMINEEALNGLFPIGTLRPINE